MNNGNINGGSGVPMEIATKNLTVSSSGGGVEYRLHNTNPDSDPVTLASTSLFSLFALTATGSITVADITVSLGSISLISDTGTIAVNGNLTADTSITVLNNDPGGYISVADSVTLSSGGETALSISTGGSPTRTFPASDNNPPTHQTIPDNITVSPSLSSNVYFGGIVPNGITAGSSLINAGTSGAVVALDTNGVTSTQISLGAGVELTAS